MSHKKVYKYNQKKKNKLSNRDELGKIPKKKGKKNKYNFQICIISP